MKLNTQSPLVVLCLFFTIITLFSCSKDSDLLAEYVALDPDVLIGKYVRNDTFQVSISNNSEDETFEIIVNSDGGGTENGTSGGTIDDTYQTSTSASIMLNVLANDTFTNIEEVEISETSQPNGGDVIINSDNTLTFTPFTVEVTEETFTYTVEFVKEDGSVGKESATVTVNINLPQDINSGPLKAFPSAFGGGSNATGGRGKALAIITTLNRNSSLNYVPASGNDDEYYTGGLYAALQNNSVGYIVFNLSGNIELGIGGTGNQFSFAGIPGINNKTIFGQSAPKGGITLTGGTFRLDGTKGDNQNLIIRHLRSRPIFNRDGALSTEDDAYTWAFLFFGGNNIIVDHCSASFAQDKAMGAFIKPVHLPNHTLKHLTFSNNLMGDSHTGAYTSINPYQSGDPEKYVDLVSWNKNVIVSLNRTPNLAFSGRAEKLNNILHNIPFKQTSVYHDMHLNEIGNYYSKSSKINIVRDDFDETGTPLIYTSRNYFEGLLNGSNSENNEKIWVSANTAKQPTPNYFVSSPFSGFPNPMNILSPQEAFYELIDNGDVGAYKYLDDNGNVKIFRDSFDSSQLSIVSDNKDYNIREVSNWVLPSIPYNVRPANYDSDHDGMADEWEIREFGNLSQSYRGDYNGNGYENIEDYMNQVDFN